MLERKFWAVKSSYLSPHGQPLVLILMLWNLVGVRHVASCQLHARRHDPNLSKIQSLWPLLMYLDLVRPSGVK
jgi:hypothetical protein